MIRCFIIHLSIVVSLVFLTGCLERETNNTDALDLEADVAVSPPPEISPPPAIAPFDAIQAREYQQAWAKHLGVPVEFENSIGMRLVHIPAGEFLMGSPDSDGAADDHEKPQHQVQITKPFYLGVYEVTQEEYEEVMGTNNSRFKDDPRLPIQAVSWNDAVKFCVRLSSLPEEQAAGRSYRLPTEAEREYACRAGSSTVFCFGKMRSSQLLGEYAWYAPNAGKKTHPVGQKEPNAWGLYDMHGNVREWCFDWYSPDYYAQSQLEDPTGPPAGSKRVVRDGTWHWGPGILRSANREGFAPNSRFQFLSFRVALSPSGLAE